MALVSSLRSLPVSLNGDEVTYFKIANEIANHNRFYHNDLPSMVSPVIPAIILITSFFNPDESLIWLSKLLSFIIAILGVLFLLKCLKFFNISNTLLYCIVALTICNPIFVSWSSSLYPESIAFFGFWMFLYYIIKLEHVKDLCYALIAAILLVFTRYVYVVLLIPILFTIWTKRKLLISSVQNTKYYLYIIIVVLMSIPMLYWMHYIIGFLGEQSTSISYVSRYDQGGIWGQIKVGLGLEKGVEVSRINGIPAFINVFFPINGYRNWWLSILLLAGVIWGWSVMKSSKAKHILIITTSAMLISYVFAGTGFSRYWMNLIPVFLIGFITLAKRFKLSSNLISILSILLCTLYVINELRLDILIIQRDW